MQSCLLPEKWRKVLCIFCKIKWCAYPDKIIHTSLWVIPSIFGGVKNNSRPPVHKNIQICCLVEITWLRPRRILWHNRQYLWSLLSVSKRHRPTFKVDIKLLTLVAEVENVKIVGKTWFIFFYISRGSGWKITSWDVKKTKPGYQRKTFPNFIPIFVILDHKDTLSLLGIRQLVFSK